MPSPKKNKLIKPLATSIDKFGRPSKLTPEVITKAWEYLSQTTSISPNAGGLIPTKERLALTLNVSRNTMYEWAKQSHDFQDILDSLDKMQADILLQYGLTGKYNSTIAKLMLSKHGYIEKTEQEQTVKVVQPIMGGLAKEVIDVSANDSNQEDI